jgi:hypothetical protein
MQDVHGFLELGHIHHPESAVRIPNADLSRLGLFNSHMARPERLFAADRSAAPGAQGMRRGEVMLPRRREALAK